MIRADEAQPEASVRKECSCAERVVFLPLHDPRDDLGESSIEDTHRKDHRTERKEPGIVHVQEDRCHAESQQPEGRWICGCIQ